MTLSMIYGIIILTFYSIFKITSVISDEENCEGYCKNCRAKGKCTKR